MGMTSLFVGFFLVLSVLSYLATYLLVILLTTILFVSILKYLTLKLATASQIAQSQGGYEDNLL